MDTAHTFFDRMVRAACGFESLYVRDGEVDSSAVHPCVRDMRVSIAAFRPKKSARRLFCMFRLTHRGPREVL